MLLTVSISVHEQTFKTRVFLVFLPYSLYCTRTVVSMRPLGDTWDLPLSRFDHVTSTRPLWLAAVCKHGERLALSARAETSNWVKFFMHIRFGSLLVCRRAWVERCALRDLFTYIKVWWAGVGSLFLPISPGSRYKLTLLAERTVAREHLIWCGMSHVLIGFWCILFICNPGSIWLIWLVSVLRDAVAAPGSVIASGC